MLKAFDRKFRALNERLQEALLNADLMSILYYPRVTLDRRTARCAKQHRNLKTGGDRRVWELLFEVEAPHVLSEPGRHRAPVNRQGFWERIVDIRNERETAENDLFQAQHMRDLADEIWERIGIWDKIWEDPYAVTEEDLLCRT